MKFGISPAACHVDPEVSSPFSTRIVSVQPSCAKAYSSPAPIAPPPTITQRACSAMPRSPPADPDQIAHAGPHHFRPVRRGDPRLASADRIQSVRVRASYHRPTHPNAHFPQPAAGGTRSADNRVRTI